KSKGQSRWDNYVLKTGGTKIESSKVKAVENEMSRFCRGRGITPPIFNRLLGSFSIYPLKKLMGTISDPLLRARFLMFMAELYRKHKFEVASVEISKQEMPQFLKLLQEFDLTKLQKLVKNGEEGEVVISLGNGNDH
ncbi:MAG TPA: hypothetical protein VMD02_04175, partial [Candidatus Omnitrophota bacterium]|nr:hypothetical protein [Candidatus Omnitrophota bacterium]